MASPEEPALALEERAADRDAALGQSLARLGESDVEHGVTVEIDPHSVRLG